MRVTPVQYKSGERITNTLGAGGGSAYAVQHAELGAAHAKKSVFTQVQNTNKLLIENSFVGKLQRLSTFKPL